MTVLDPKALEEMGTSMRRNFNGEKPSEATTPPCGNVTEGHTCMRTRGHSGEHVEWLFDGDTLHSTQWSQPDGYAPSVECAVSFEVKK